VNRRDVIDAIIFAATAERIVYEPHARQRMRERGVRREDVRNALMNLKDCKATSGDRWKVTGPDLDGEALTVVLVIEGNLVVITVF
jgi:hypothetical protein